MLLFNGGILKFGSFELKSKRISPSFFNAGNFYRADLLRAIGTAFAKLIIEATTDSDIEFDIIFDYHTKLAELAPEKFGQICYSFDRKEAKDYGEGGNIVGAPLKGKRVLIIDDVVTAGTAKREAIDKIRKEGGIVIVIVLALTRMEKVPAPNGDDSAPMPSASSEIRKEYGVPLLSIITLNDIISGLRGLGSEDDIREVRRISGQVQSN